MTFCIIAKIISLWMIITFGDKRERKKPFQFNFGANYRRKLDCKADDIWNRKKVGFKSSFKLIITIDRMNCAKVLEHEAID